jgi:SAM-dependent methyltransferase
MDIIDYEFEFYKKINARVGPGSDAASAQALNYIPHQGKTSHILDIGCGTGAQTLFLARSTEAKIIAIDIVRQYIEKLQSQLHALELSDRVSARMMSMDQIPYPEGFFDLIWAENSIYHIGFERGIGEWRKYLRPGGYLAVSELSWLTAERPGELEEYLNRITSPGMIGCRLAALEKHGYRPIAHFVLPEDCWTKEFHNPSRKYAGEFLREHNYNDVVKQCVQILDTEIAMRDKYKEYYGVVFFVAQKPVGAGDEAS